LKEFEELGRMELIEETVETPAGESEASGEASAAENA
jgi:hypothetical protein